MAQEPQKAPKQAATPGAQLMMAATQITVAQLMRARDVAAAAKLKVSDDALVAIAQIIATNVSTLARGPLPARKAATPKT